MAVSDWDFQYGASYHSLSPTYFVSTPTALKMGDTTPSGGNALLSRLTDVQCVPEGELRTWLRCHTSTDSLFIFRNQAALGVANVQNTYGMTISGGNCTLWKMLGGVYSAVGTFACAITSNVWQHWRAVWWNGENLTGTAAMVFQLYLADVDGNWVLKGTLYDTVNSWKDSSINRVGLIKAGADSVANYYDDTEIWTPTA
jgi:hypothetical protein